jgi:activator of 2-hydroxyglutaryl-CoA dehydratase
VISLIARGTNREEIANGLCWSIAERIGSMVKKVGVNDLIFVSGGIAYNQAVVSALSSHLQKKVTMLSKFKKLL